MSVKRYDSKPYGKDMSQYAMNKCESGDFVRYVTYLKLESKNEQLKKENEAMQGSIGALVAICKTRGVGAHSEATPNKQIIDMLEKHVKP